MKAVSLLFWTVIGVVGARSEATLPAVRVLDSMMLTQVYLNGSGPFRMMLDTGAEASLLRPAVAARIGARAQYQVEQVTAAGSSTVAAGLVTVRVGVAEDAGVEMLYAPPVLRDADGVLGQSWLRRHSYLLDFRKRRVILDGQPPAEGLRVPLRESDGRPCIAAQVDGEARELILDSGASALVLFGGRGRFAQRARMVTNNGSIDAGVGRAVVAIGAGGFRREVTAAEIPGEAVQGLLPASAFQWIYIAGDRRVAVLATR
ncbi:MAG: retropepsin-like aspartic protease [Bryobacteraceae bacterium]